MDSIKDVMYDRKLRFELEQMYKEGNVWYYIRQRRITKRYKKCLQSRKNNASI